MKIKIPFAALAVVLAVLSMPQLASAQGTLGTNTLVISGAVFDNGSTLDGTFTYSYDTTYNSLDTLLSADLTVGGSTNLTAFEYLFNIPGQTDTAKFPVGSPAPAPSPGGAAPSPHPAPAPGGDPSNSFTLASTSDSSAITLFFSLNPYNFDEASIDDASGNLAGSLNNAAGILGTLEVESAPEPSTLALASLGVAGFFIFRRRLSNS